MGKDRLEEFIKGQVFDYESEVNTEELWGKLQKKKRRKTPILFISLIGLGLVLGVAGYFWISNSIVSTSSTQNISNTNTPYSQEDKENKNERTNDKVSKQALKDRSNKTNSSNNVSDIEPTIEETKTANGGINTITRASKKLSKQETNSTKIPLQNFTNKNLDYTESILKSENLFIQETGVLSGSTLINSLTATRNTNSESLSKVIINNNTEQDNEDRQTWDISAISFGIPDLLSSERVYPYFEFQNLPDDITSEVSVKRWSTSVGIYSSYYKGARILHSIDTSSTLLDLRQEKEKFVEAWDLGLELNLEHSSGFSLHTGLAYRQINDRSIIIEENRDLSVPTPIGFQGVQVQVDRMERVRYNKIGMIDVPLMLGYRLKRDRNSYSVRVGVNFNLQTRTKGNIINDLFLENEEVSAFINTADNELFKSNIGISYQIELGYHRVLQKGYELSVHPVYRYYTNTFHNSVTNSIDQKYRHLGMKLSLSKWF